MPVESEEKVEAEKLAPNALKSKAKEPKVPVSRRTKTLRASRRLGLSDTSSDSSDTDT